MDRHVGNHRVVPVPHVIVLLGARFARIGQRHVVERLQLRHFEGPGRIHRRRRRRPHERRRLLHLRGIGRRNRDDVMIDDELADRIERVLRGLEQLVGGWMVGLHRGEHLVGTLVRIDLPGRRLERRLVLPAIRFGGREEIGRRHIDHLVVGEREPVHLVSVCEAAGRLRQQRLLEIRFVVTERADHIVVALSEGIEERLVTDLGERGRQIVLEEPDVAVDLLDRDLGVDPRRRPEIFARLEEHTRHLLLARNQGGEALRRGRVIALHDHVRRVGDRAAVRIGILRPLPDAIECEHARVERALQLLAIELSAGGQRRGIDRRELRAELLQRLRFGVDRGFRRIFELGIVLVEAEVGRRARMALVVIVQNLPRELGERRVARARTGRWRLRRSIGTRNRRAESQHEHREHPAQSRW